MILIKNVKKPSGPLMTISEKVDKIVNSFTQKMTYKSYLPHQLVREYMPYLDQIEQEWYQYNDHTVIVGRKNKRIFIKKLCYFSIEQYIFQTYKFTIHRGKKESYSRLSYDINKYIDLSYIVTTLLFIKYQEVYTFEVKFSILKLLLEYFSYYDENNTWTCTPDDINYVISQVINTHVESLNKFKTMINVDIFQPKAVLNKKPKIKKLKPKCADDLLSLRTDDMSIAEWYDTILSTWHISRKSMYNYFHTFGIETRQYGDTPTLTQKLSAENELLKRQVAELKNMIININR